MAGNAVNPTENVLYVVLHGLISLVDVGDDGFNAYMFDMGADHRYLFGNWLIESDALEQKKPPKVLTLDSVVGAIRDPLTNVLNPDLNLVIQLDARPSIIPGTRAVIHLPRPRRIYYYTRGQLAPNSITGNLSKLVNGTPPSFISGVRVFEYTFPDPQTLQLLAGDPPAGDPVWTPDVLATVGNRNVATLHFYDEPGEPFDDDDMAEQHARDEFQLSTTNLGVPLTLTQPSLGNISIPPGPPELDKLGLLEGEVTPLDERSLALLELQFFARCLKHGPRPKPQQNPPHVNTTGGGGGPICGGANAQVG